MGKNVTEQQRIAAALESMVDTSDSEGKKNVTEQQRIASALEAMAEGGGGSGGDSNLMICHISNTQSGYCMEESFEGVLSFFRNGGMVLGKDYYGVFSLVFADMDDDVVILRFIRTKIWNLKGTIEFLSLDSDRPNQGILSQYEFNITSV